MNHEHTVSLDQGFAPTAPEQQLGAMRDAVTGNAPDNAQGLVNLEGHKRIKTWGETIFNLKTYAGVALLGNEATSLIITHQAEHGIGKNWFAKNMARFNALEGKKFVPAYVHQGNLFKVLIALVGGMLMVPFVKHLEDNKGEIVRNYDRKHYGPDADRDPAIAEAHKEMDAAPKQSWGSLWKGRALTVVAAIGVDWLMGSKDAPSTKLFKPDAKYSSMDRIAEQISTKTMNALKIAEKSRPTWDRWLKQGSWLMVLSTTLTALFYASSKLFATSRDHKMERREDALHQGSTQRDEESTALPAEMASSPEKAAQPQLQVSSITRENTLAATPQLAQSI